MDVKEKRLKSLDDLVFGFEGINLKEWFSTLFFVQKEFAEAFV